MLFYWCSANCCSLYYSTLCTSLLSFPLLLFLFLDQLGGLVCSVVVPHSLPHLLAECLGTAEDPKADMIRAVIESLQACLHLYNTRPLQRFLPQGGDCPASSVHHNQPNAKIYNRLRLVGSGQFKCSQFFPALSDTSKRFSSADADTGSSTGQNLAQYAPNEYCRNDRPR
jgi:hypothetical protein